jgi:hypothetical protein
VPRFGQKTVNKSARKLKKFPPLLSDEEAERFLESADLSEFDFSEFKPTQLKFVKDTVRKVASKGAIRR